MPLLNNFVTKKRKLIPFHKRADKRLSDIQKGLVFVTSAFLEIADELIRTQSETRQLELREDIGPSVVLLP